VVVASGNRVVMSETLDQALDAMFGDGSAVRASGQGTSQAAPPEASAPAGPTATLLQQAQSHYDKAISAQRAGNWTEYGREIDALGEVLQQLRE